ncbi:MAG TPA: hypothetical protein VMG08_03890 [Allosphingosinicella sp.]|nr:hypothetical protein [Allosphingosinicella sp.]
MKLTAIAAAIAVIAVPMAVQGAPAPTKAAPSTKRICTITPTIGSRVNNTRRCRTEAEREEAKQEARNVTDRVQLFRPCNSNAAFGQGGC